MVGIPVAEKIRQSTKTLPPVSVSDPLVAQRRRKARPHQERYINTPELRPPTRSASTIPTSSVSIFSFHSQQKYKGVRVHFEMPSCEDTTPQSWQTFWIITSRKQARKNRHI